MPEADYHQKFRVWSHRATSARVSVGTIFGEKRVEINEHEEERVVR